MKHLLFLTAFLASLAAVAEDPVVAYRGRLVPAANPAGQAFDFACTKQVTCRIYPTQEGGSPVFTSTQTVKVAKDGTFECLLSGEALTKAVQAGKARYIGLSVGAATEIAPRRSLLPLARAAYAESADALASVSRVSEADVGAFTANQLTASSLSVGGTLTTSNATDAVRLTLLAPASGKELKLGCAGKTKVLPRAEWEKCYQITGIWKKGDTIATAPADGIVLLHQLNPPATGTRVLAVPLFCTKGDVITCPCTVDAALTASFLSFTGEE